MPRKGMKISMKKDGKITPVWLAKETKDGLMLKPFQGTKHLTIIDDGKESLHFHTTDEKTNTHVNVPFGETLEKATQEIERTLAVYTNVEEFRREYQDANISYWDEDAWEYPQYIDPTNPNHVIIDMDQYFERLEDNLRNLVGVKVLEFDFDTVPNGETLLIIIKIEEKNKMFYLQRIEDEWYLTDGTELYERLVGMGKNLF